MIFEDVLRDMLVSTNLVERRVFLVHAPQVPADQQQTPYMVFQNVGPAPLHTMRGPLDVIDREYQISIFDTMQSRALGIADSLRIKLDGYKGDYEGIRFGAIFYRAQTVTYSGVAELYDVVTSFQILFQYLGVLPAGNPSSTANPPKHHQRSFKRK